MGADSVIYIRADGNTEIATGHLVRCLSVARALKKEQQAAGTTFTDSDGFPITFLVSDQDGGQEGTGQQAGGRLQNAGIRALSEDNLPGMGLQLFDQKFKHL